MRNGNDVLPRVSESMGKMKSPHKDAMRKLARSGICRNCVEIARLARPDITDFFKLGVRPSLHTLVEKGRPMVWCYTCGYKKRGKRIKK